MITPSSTRWRGRALALVSLTVVLLTGIPPVSDATTTRASSVAKPGAHLRFEVTSTSDWASVSIEPVSFYTSTIVGDAYGVARTERSVRVDGARTGVVEALVDVLPSGDATFRVRKGVIGTTTVVVSEIDAAGRATVLTTIVDTVARDALNEVAVTVPFSAMQAAAVELGATDPECLVIAAFYPWWTGNERSKIVPDAPAGTWQTDAVASIAPQLELMAGAGINTVALSMGWPQYDRQVMTAATIEAASKQSAVRLVPYVELENAVSFLGWSDVALDHLIGEAATIARSMPATFVHRDGRPVLFFYSDQKVPADVWNASVARVEAAKGPIFAVTQSVDPGRRSDGIHSYLDLGSEDDRWGRAFGRLMIGRIQPIVHQDQPSRLVVGTVSPGLDDRSVQPLFPRLVPREGGAYYQRSWDIAMGARPDWMFITSWNEWWEQTHIAPSSAAGTAALDITRARAGSFCSSG